MSGIPAVRESIMTEVLELKEESGVIAIVDDNIEDTSSNSDSVTVDVDNDSGDGEKESLA